MIPGSVEQEVETVMVVTVRSFGYPDKMCRDSVLAVHRALHHSLGDDYSVSVNGTEITYDAFADDGHHVAGLVAPGMEHETVLSPLNGSTNGNGTSPGA